MNPTMSIVISYKESDLSSRLFDMLKAVSDESYIIFTDYLRKVVADKGLNYREIASRSGGSVTHSTVHDILAGRSRNPTVSTLKGLAKGIGVPESELFDAARGADTNGGNNLEAEFLSYIRELPESRRNDLLRLAKMYFSELNEPAETTATFSGKIGGGLRQQKIDIDGEKRAKRDDSNVSEPRKRGGKR